MSGPLGGIRVVELAMSIQGPAAGLYFANMGADVIKVEPPFGDASRYHRGVNNTLPENAPGSQFLAMNKGKRSVALDAHTNLGAEVIRRLLASADVFLTNYRSAALTRMGLDVNELLSKYPQLVIGHANGFGPRGEEADKAMLDGAAQARGGLISMTGFPGEIPIVTGVTVADHAGAMQLALGCVTGLVARGATGKGQLVQTSSLGGQLWLQMWELQHSAMTGVSLSREGRHHPNIKAPYGVYATSDDQAVLFVTAQTDEAWSSFWIYMDKPEVLLIDEWDTPGKRIGMAGSDQQLPEIRALMCEAIGSKTMAELDSFFRSEPEIIWERVRDYGDVLNDPQNIDNGYLVNIEVPGAGSVKTVGPLIDFGDTPAPDVRLPPELSADTLDLMQELGFTAEEASSLMDHSEAVRAELFAAMWGED
ncbi:MAG: CoA transferase [Pseudomonadales bacterium]|nr:CoA transferase [Pseudomonadales bacterium]MDP6469415.1 CoA transferase [Pseudomonadales bacterium]MDP6827257.1 CoA transferase [Pseudomonadales bacterium]MDP6970443.1 CoA transferase [Pseudomonadales bacterium]